MEKTEQTAENGLAEKKKRVLGFESTDAKRSDKHVLQGHHKATEEEGDERRPGEKDLENKCQQQFSCTAGERWKAQDSGGRTQVMVMHEDVCVICMTTNNLTRL